jgi:uncharacterized protein (DUF1330 family)
MIGSRESHYGRRWQICRSRRQDRCDFRWTTQTAHRCDGVFESMEKAKAAFGSSAYKEAKKVGDKYAKFRVYAVEGLSQ